MPAIAPGEREDFEAPPGEKGGKGKAGGGAGAYDGVSRVSGRDRTNFFKSKYI